MANYNQTTQEIARPSDLLAGIRVYTATLHSLYSYISVDVTRLVRSVLLQQTQPLDSHGGQTITTIYTNWCVIYGFIFTVAACKCPFRANVSTYINSLTHKDAQEAESHMQRSKQCRIHPVGFTLLFLFFALLNGVACCAQVPGKSLASGQQLPHCPLSHHVLLCQPNH